MRVLSNAAAASQRGPIIDQDAHAGTLPYGPDAAVPIEIGGPKSFGVSMLL